MEKQLQHIAIIAGPNGAGKSTCGPAVLKNHFKISEFVNADTIAAGLSAFQPEAVAIEAGRLMLKRIKSLAIKRDDFAFETTLASRTFSPWIKSIKQQGYQFTLIYFWLHSAELAIERVAERVRLGGHSVPEDTIKRRYQNSLLNFFTLYQPIADNWAILDNSDKESPVIIAEGNKCLNITIHHPRIWDSIRSI